MDDATPVSETIGAFAQLVAEGTIRAYGGSNVDAAWLEEALRHGNPARAERALAAGAGRRERRPPHRRARRARLHALQPARWRLADREVPPRRGAAVRVADDARPEPYRHLQDGRVFDALEAFEANANERGTMPAALAIAWLLGHHTSCRRHRPAPPRSPPPALEALGELDLSPPEREQLAGLFA